VVAMLITDMLIVKMLNAIILRVVSPKIYTKKFKILDKEELSKMSKMQQITFHTFSAQR
jgi:hypothetical protein